VVAVGEHFIVLLRERHPPEPDFTAPLVALIERGREDGQIRSDTITLNGRPARRIAATPWVDNHGCTRCPA